MEMIFFALFMIFAVLFGSRAARRLDRPVSEKYLLETADWVRNLRRDVESFEEIFKRADSGDRHGASIALQGDNVVIGIGFYKVFKRANYLLSRPQDPEEFDSLAIAIIDWLCVCRHCNFALSEASWYFEDLENYINAHCGGIAKFTQLNSSFYVQVQEEFRKKNIYL